MENEHTKNEQLSSAQPERVVPGLPNSLHRQAQIAVKVQNLTKAGAELLETLLTEWAEWQKQQYAQGYPAGEHLYRGTLTLDTDQLYNQGMVVWHDTLCPSQPPSQSAGPATAAASDANPHLHEAPVYDRGSNLALVSPPKNLKARKWDIYQTGQEKANTATPEQQPAAKRLRLGPQRCFNCNSYAHGLADCPKARDQAAINAGLRAQKAAKAERAEWAEKRREQNMRYFEVMPANDAAAAADGTNQLYPDAKPGLISPELAAALGMSSCTAPPPWLNRMVQLGLPPGYCHVEGGEEQVAAAAEDDGGGMDVVLGSESEDEGRHGLNHDAKKAAGNGREGEGTTGMEGAAECGQQGQQQEGDNSGAARAGAGKVENGLGEGGLPDSVWDDLKKLRQGPGGHEGGLDKSKLQEGQARTPPPAVENGQLTVVANGGHLSDGEGAKVVCRVQIPGLNAPIPEAADKRAWELEIGTGPSPYA